MAKREFTCGSFIINLNQELLVIHPTGAKSDFWSVPKGRAEEGESYISAAERELVEETNLDSLDLSGAFFSQSFQLSPESYTKRRKTLIPFVYMVDNSLNDYPFHCEIKPDDKGQPEVDAFAWVSLARAKEILHYTQVRVVQYIEKLLKEEEINIVNNGS